MVTRLLEAVADFRSLLRRREPAYFYAFDLLRLNGSDLRQLPLVRRKEQVLPTCVGMVRLRPSAWDRMNSSPHERGDGPSLTVTMPTIGRLACRKARQKVQKALPEF
jgi:hypothetical protein